MNNVLAKIKNGSLDWFFPPVCLLCGDLLPLEKSNREICPECYGEIPFIKGNVCQSCGRPLETVGICKTCIGKSHIFKRGFVAFEYRHMRFAIRHFKFLGNKIDAVPLGNWMYEFINKNAADMWNDIDYLIPVPIHKKRLQYRGFNQAALLALELEKRTGIPCVLDNLIRTKQTVPQSQLNEMQRYENCRDAFGIINREEIVGKVIMLIDDIFTTGVTIHSCAKMLLEAGASEVIPYCLSIVHFDNLEDLFLQ